MTVQMPLLGETARRETAQPVEWPRYPRCYTQRICHLGVGAFHRAHQAAVLHDLLQQGQAEGWGLCGIALRPADAPLFAALRAQDRLYSLWETDGDQRRVRVIGSIMQLVDAIDDPGVAIAALSDAATHIVSLTITEAGYCLDARGGLDLQHADIAHDLAHPTHPRSAPGLLVAALHARRASGVGAFTLMSCDNLIENGHRLRSAVMGVAQALDPSLAQWIAQHASFPLSMVDRITPAADAARNAALCAQWGLRDEALVLCEPWQQWVLEDRFVAGRPTFERAGVVMSGEVPAYEAMKLGLLNGGHSAIAHLGLMLGHDKVHEAMAQPLIADWLAAYQREVASTLIAPSGVDLSAYMRSIARRFANPTIKDRLLRLAQDTRDKFRQALLPPLCRRLERGEPIPALATAVALWMRYLAGLQNDASTQAAYTDRDRDALIALAAGGDVPTFLQRALPIAPALSIAFATAVSAAYAELESRGIHTAVAALSLNRRL